MQNLGIHFGYVVFVSVCLVWVCVISISVSATDGPNPQFCYFLVSRPRLIARQEQQQEAVCVCLCVCVCAGVCCCVFACVGVCCCVFACVHFRMCLLAGTFIYKPSCWKDSLRFGTHAWFWRLASCLKWLWVCLFAYVCWSTQLCVCVCGCVSLYLSVCSRMRKHTSIPVHKIQMSVLLFK